MKEREKGTKEDLFLITNMRPLLPSLREKKRYMSIEIIGEKHVQTAEAFEVLRAKFNWLVGSLASAKANLRLLKESNNKMVIRVHRKFVDSVRAALCLTTEVSGQKVIFRTIRVSGSIANVKEESQ